MSKVYQNYKGSVESSSQMFLKMSDGTIFGPVDISVLCDWAAQGRIVVGNTVSTDNQNWVPAETVPDLEMTWVAELRSGQRYGPFNIAAVSYLVQRGKLARAATVRNLPTGETYPVALILKSGVPARGAAAEERAEVAAPQAVSVPPAAAKPVPPVKAEREIMEIAPPEPAQEQKPAAAQPAPPVKAEPEIVEIAPPEPAKEEKPAAPAAVPRLEPAPVAAPAAPRAKRQKPAAPAAVPRLEPAPVAEPAAGPAKEREDERRKSESRDEESRRREELLSQRIRELEAEINSARTELQSGRQELQQQIQRHEMELAAIRQKEQESGRRTAERSTEEAEYEKKEDALLVSIERLEEKVLSVSQRLRQTREKLEARTTASAAAGREHAQERIRQLVARLEGIAGQAKQRAEEKRNSVVQEAETLKSRLGDIEKASGETEAALKRRAAELEAEAEEKGRRVAGLEAEVERERAARMEVESKAREVERERAAQALRAKAEAGEVAARLTELEASAGEREKELTGRIEALSEETQKAVETAEAAGREMAESGKAMSALREELAEAGRKQAELEASARESENELADAKAELARAAEGKAEWMRRIRPPAMSAKPGWYLEGEGDSVYGPVDLPELWTWAGQCRIDPLHDVSQDKKNWIPAKDIPELRMEWVFKSADGATLGPLNPFAFRELMADGQVTGESTVRNQLTGETVSVGELLKAAEESPTERPKPAEPVAQDWKQRCVKAEARSQHMAEELAQKNSLLETERTRKQQLEQELADVKKQRAELSAQLQQPAQAVGVPMPPKRLRERILAASQSPQRVEN